MNIKHLQYMIEIERVGSISQAAKNLYVGQPNLSRILREVEEAVGFTIFDRTHQGIRPTWPFCSMPTIFCGKWMPSKPWAPA